MKKSLTAAVSAAALVAALVTANIASAQTPPATSADKEVAKPTDNRGPLESPAATGLKPGASGPASAPRPGEATSADKEVAKPAGNSGPLESPAATGTAPRATGVPATPPGGKPRTEPAQGEVAKPTPQR